MTTQPSERNNVRTTAKASGLIACLSALPLVVSLTGCAGNHYNLSMTEHIEDSRTAEHVREALAAGASYKYDGIKVAASNGVVQLGGSVNSSAQRTSAGALTSKVVGVKRVENNLTVKD